MAYLNDTKQSIVALQAQHDEQQAHLMRLRRLADRLEVSTHTGLRVTYQKLLEVGVKPESLRWLRESIDRLEDDLCFFRGVDSQTALGCNALRTHLKVSLEEAYFQQVTMASPAQVPSVSSEYKAWLREKAQQDTFLSQWLDFLDSRAEHLQSVGLDVLEMCLLPMPDKRSVNGIKINPVVGCTGIHNTLDSNGRIQFTLQCQYEVPEFTHWYKLLCDHVEQLSYLGYPTYTTSNRRTGAEDVMSRYLRIRTWNPGAKTGPEPMNTIKILISPQGNI